MRKLLFTLTILVLGSVSGAGALATGTATPQEQQFALAAQSAVKIVVRDNGWYSVARKDLVAAGLSSSADARLLHLYTDGQEIPILVRHAKGGRLGSNGSIEFYGRARNLRSTDARTYWLTVESRPGQRIAVVPTPRSQGRAKARSFAFTSTHRDRLLYAGWASRDRTHFFGRPLNPAFGPVDQTIAVQDLDLRSGQATLRVAVHGVTTKAHKIKITLNGTELSALAFQGQVEAVANLAVPRSALKEGANVVTLTASASEIDFNVIDELSLTYARLMRASSDYLNFAIPEQRRVSVTGFTKSSLRLFDITHPQKPRVLAPTTKRSNDGWALTIGADGQYHRYLAMTAAGVKHPASVVAERPSSWHDDSHGADLVIISHGDFLDALKPLKELRERQGLEVALIDVQDLYDEFDYGAHSPDAIKSFIMWTRAHWRPAPRFLLLVGDATYDPRNFLGKGQSDFLPTHLFEAQYTESPADGWLADANGDGIPELAVGRIPVRTADQARIAVSKIVGYDEAGRTSPGNTALLVADSDGKLDFNTPIDRLRPLFPGSFSVDVTRLTDGPTDAAVRKRLIGRLNEGPSVVNYFGHGAISLWSHAALFETKDASKLQNGRDLSLYVMMSCLNGYFVDPTATSLVEGLLLNPDGGAVAAVSSTGLSNAAPQPALNQAFIRALFANPDLTVGQVLNEAKKSTSEVELRQTQLLFGDPTMRLHY